MPLLCPFFFEDTRGTTSGLEGNPLDSELVHRSPSSEMFVLVENADLLDVATLERKLAMGTVVHLPIAAPAEWDCAVVATEAHCISSPCMPQPMETNADCQFLDGVVEVFHADRTLECQEVEEPPCRLGFPVWEMDRDQLGDVDPADPRMPNEEDRLHHLVVWDAPTLAPPSATNQEAQNLGVLDEPRKEDKKSFWLLLAKLDETARVEIPTINKLEPLCLAESLENSLFRLTDDV